MKNSSEVDVDDVFLLAQIAQQDQSALSTLYDRYARIIYSLAFKSLRSIEESEEVVMDVFTQVWQIANRYDRQRGRADVWLFTLARSRILDRLRRVQRTRASTLVSIEAQELQLKADNPDMLEEVWVKEWRTQVLVAMQTLPEEQRVALELAYYQGLTQTQIATQTGVALGTVKTRIRLGLNKLKSLLCL